MKVLIIDNYDSFTYNLVHLIEKITNTATTVLLNDQFELNEVEKFDKIVLSPGFGLPQDAGKLMQVINSYQATKSILGVCLGHQAIGLAMGATLKNLSTVYHGVESNIYLCNNEANDTNNLFKNIAMPMLVGRYHSWVINNNNLPHNLIVTAVDEKNNIMAIKHQHYNLQGIQFHPESIMTKDGETLIKNWLQF